MIQTNIRKQQYPYTNIRKQHPLIYTNIWKQHPPDTNIRKEHPRNKYQERTAPKQILEKNTPLRQIPGNIWPPETNTAVKATKALDSLHKCHIFISLMGTQRSSNVTKLPQISSVFFFLPHHHHHHHLQNPCGSPNELEANDLNTSQQ